MILLLQNFLFGYQGFVFFFVFFLSYIIFCVQGVIVEHNGVYHTAQVFCNETFHDRFEGDMEIVVRN